MAVMKSIVVICWVMISTPSSTTAAVMCVAVMAVVMMVMMVMIIVVMSWRSHLERRWWQRCNLACVSFYSPPNDEREQ